ASVWASRLISQARRWRWSSAGERRSRSSWRSGPGSSNRTRPAWAPARPPPARPPPRPAPPAGERAPPQPIDDDRPIDHVLAQLVVEPVDRVRGVGPVGRDGALDAGAPAVPDLHLAVARAHEEDEALLGVGRIEDGDGVGLVEARQEEEVRRLAEFVVDVTVAPELLGAGDDGERVADRRREPLPPLDEGGWIEWAHQGNNTTPKGEPYARRNGRGLPEPGQGPERPR